jgi:hypothetical protein
LKKKHKEQPSKKKDVRRERGMEAEREIAAEEEEGKETHLEKGKKDPDKGALYKRTKKRR